MILIYKKSATFLHPNNKVSEKEIKKAILVAITTEIIKYLGINLPKEAKNLYSKNFKALME